MTAMVPKLLTAYPCNTTANISSTAPLSRTPGRLSATTPSYSTPILYDKVGPLGYLSLESDTNSKTDLYWDDHLYSLASPDFEWKDEKKVCFNY